MRPKREMQTEMLRLRMIAMTSPMRATMAATRPTRTWPTRVRTMLRRVPTRPLQRIVLV